MKKKFFLVVLFTLIFIGFCTSPVSAWNFDKMIAGVEKKLPIAEKQATIIVKMLNNDKHLAKIQSDIDKIRNNKPLKAKDAYLYRVLKKIDNGKIALEKSALRATLIWDCKRYSFQSLHSASLSPFSCLTCRRELPELLSKRN